MNFENKKQSKKIVRQMDLNIRVNYKKINLNNPLPTPKNKDFKYSFNFPFIICCVIPSTLLVREKNHTK